MTAREPHDAFYDELMEAISIPLDALAHRDLPDGRVLDVYALLWGRARLLLSRDATDQGAIDVWEYPSVDSATTALGEWDGEGDAPYGWDRHPRSGRRRPDGDATREHVHD